MEIIVTGHGNFASGFQSTVKLLAGSIEQIKYIDFTEKMTEESLSDEFLKIIIPNKKYIFFCDLVGGTPYKEAAKISTKNANNIGVVAGCNIGSLLEVGIRLDGIDDNIEQITKDLLDISLKGTQVFKLKKIKNDEITDGI